MNAQTEETTQTSKAPKSKAEIEKVTMEDGRTVEFAGKRKLLKEYTVDETHHHVTTRFDFRNGRVVEWQVPKSLLLQCAGHGAIQKIGDETAGEDNVDDMVEGVLALISRLDKGEWRVAREGGGFAGTSILLRAMVEYSETTGKPRTPEQVREFLSTKTQAEKLALRGSAQLKPIIARLEAEKAEKAPKVDTESLLESL